MTKRVLLVFTESSITANIADPEALAKLLRRPGLDVVWTCLEDFVFSLENGKQPVAYDTRNGSPVEAYGAVYLRSWSGQDGHAIAVARICKRLGVPCIDNELVQIGSRTKISQYVMMHEQGLPIPKTLMGSPGLLRDNYRKYGFAFPLIMKDKSGTRGRDNYLVHSDAQLERVCRENGDKTFILQEYLPNEGDFRVIVIRGEARMVIHRQAKGESHLNNISQGGIARLLSLQALPRTVLSLCEQAAQLFGRDVAGVDVVQSKQDGAYYLFEVNRAPQIEHASFRQEKADLLATLFMSL